MKLSHRLIAIPFFTVSLFLIIFLGGCKKEDTATPAQQTTLATNNIHGLLDDEEIIVQNNASYFTDDTTNNTGSIHYTDQHSSGNTEDEDGDDKSLLVTGCEWHNVDNTGNHITTGTIQVRKEVFRIYVTPFLNSTVYYGMVQAGSYNYAYTNNNKNGAYLSITDKAGMLWTSKGDQTGSTFQITSRGANQQTFTTIAGTATCKMYNTQGNVKTFTGTFSAITGL